MNSLNKIISCICAAALFMPPVCLAYDDALSVTTRYVYEKNPAPSFSSIGGEWAVIGLARSGYGAPEEYYREYYRKITDLVSEDGFITRRRSSDYSRLILAMTAIGADAQNIAEINLMDGISDYDKTVSQGINGPVWALIAADCGEYSFTEPSVCDEYIEYIIENRNSDGGWALVKGDTSDTDISAMAITALSAYAEDSPSVSEAVSDGLKFLSDTQNEDGTYSSCGVKNAESTAQVIVALTESGIPLSDEAFIKNGNDLISALMMFSDEGGGFKHTMSDTAVNAMATEQTLYALAAADRAAKGQNGLFDMSDTQKRDFTYTASGLPEKIMAVHPPRRLYSITFSDTAGSIYENDIKELATYGIINGRAENSFEPDGTMTRAEFAAVTVRALGLDKIENDMFSDVTREDWFFESVNTAYSYNIVKGISDSIFNPYGVITRREAAVMVSRASTLAGMETSLSDTSIRNTLAAFTDYMTVPDWAREPLAFCFNEGMLDDSALEINHDTLVTRGEIAHMIYTMLCRANLVYYH